MSGYQHFTVLPARVVNVAIAGKPDYVKASVRFNTFSDEFQFQFSCESLTCPNMPHPSLRRPESSSRTAVS